MNLKRVGVLAPCDGLADFPTYFRGDDAASLLAAWTAAWRPALIATTGHLPELLSSYDLPPGDTWSDGVLLVTNPSIDGETAEWLETVRTTHADSSWIIEGFVDRPTVIANLDASLPDLPAISAEFEAEMFALGYAYLQVATLTHELSYGSVFDPEMFEQVVVEAARAAVESDQSTFDTALERCYDLLLQARNHSYPVEISLIDVLLVAPTTLGDSLADELIHKTPINVLLPGALARAMADKAPDSLARLKAAVDTGHASVLTGGHQGDDLSTRDPESMFDELRLGQSTVEAYLGAKPCVFAQRATAFGPRLPQALRELGFKGALLVGFDGRQPPMQAQGRTTWMGIDGEGIEATVATPYDLAQADTLLRLNELLSETLQRDHCATVLMAGYPGARSAHLDDLRRVAHRSEVLGQFVTLESYFDAIGPADHWGHFEQNAHGPVNAPASAPLVTEVGERLGNSLSHFACAVAGVETPEPDKANRPATFERFGQAFSNAAAAPCDTARLTVNPWSFPTASDVLVPAMGFALPGGSPAHPAQPRAEENLLRNETLEATISSQTGGMRSIRPYSVRKNHASQRLLISRQRSNSHLTQMVAESVEIVENSANAGAIRSRGRLVEGRGRTFATFEQTATLSAGAEWLLFDVRVEAGEALPGGADNFQVAFRLAIGEAPWQWHRGLQWCRLPVSRSAFVAGEYAIANDGATAISLACAQPTLLRRVGSDQLDAILPWNKAGVATARFALAIDHRLPLQSCLGGLGGLLTGDVAMPRPGPPSGWWVHSSAANVMASRIDLNKDRKSQAIVRLVETEGRAATAKIRFCRPIRHAVLQGFDGADRESLAVTEGVAQVEIGPYGWLQVAASW